MQAHFIMFFWLFAKNRNIGGRAQYLFNMRKFIYCAAAAVTAAVCAAAFAACARDIDYSDFISERRFKTYLYASVKHACLRYFRRLRLLDEYKKRQAEALVLSFADDDTGEDPELVECVQQALSRLSEQQRKIVELHVMEGKKYLEIAELLQLSENTVRTHLKRAYKILRENLASLFPFLF